MINLFVKVLVSVLALTIVLTECSAPGSAESDRLKLTVVFNNEPLDDRLETSWGFACLIEGLENENPVLSNTSQEGLAALFDKDVGRDPAKWREVVRSTR